MKRKVDARSFPPLLAVPHVPLRRAPPRRAAPLRRMSVISLARGRPEATRPMPTAEGKARASRRPHKKMEAKTIVFHTCLIYFHIGWFIFALFACVCLCFSCVLTFVIKMIL